MLKTVISHLTIAFLLILGHCALAQNMRTYDVTSGLSSNCIKGMIQDTRGYIWFATTDGLNVYNGAGFNSYGCSYRGDEDNSISVLNALTILQHRDGRRIWTGNQSSSLMLFDPDSETFKEIPLDKVDNNLPPPNLCFSLAYDKDGRLWIGTDAGIYIYDEDSDRFTIISSRNSNIESDLIQSVYCDDNGTIWIGGDKGLFRYNHSTNSFVKAMIDHKSFGHKEAIHITMITEGPSDNLWIGTWNNGLAMFDKNSNTMNAVKPSGDNEYSRTMRIRNILTDTADLLWICTNVGVFKYDIISNSISQVVLSTTHPDDNIYSILKDHEGGIWIGTFFSGAYYLSPRARQIECYTPQNVEGHLNGTAISSFYEDADGLIYITAENGGLSLFDPISRKFLATVPDISGSNLHSICIDSDQLYIGTYSHGLKIINLKNRRITTLTNGDREGVRSNNIFSLCREGEGLILIGYDNGCSRYDARNNRFEPISELDGEFIYAIIQDKRGNSWFASYYNGLFRYCHESGEWHHYTCDANQESALTHDKCINIYIDDNENLWICTEGGGVCRYDYDADCFHRLRLKQNGKSVSLSIVYGILNDSDGNLWLSSNNGIWTCLPDGTVTRHLTHEDGLQSNQFNFGSSFRSSSGKMFFGGVNGFNVINPKAIRDNRLYPTITACISYITPSGNYASSTKVFKSGDITLPRHVSSFSIDFECLSYITPRKNEFAYKIDDQSDWTYTRESSVTIMNFPHGKHTITVKAKNVDGSWSTPETILNIDNKPPVIKSTGAKIIYLVLLIGVLVIFAGQIDKRHSEKSLIKLKEIKAAQEQEAYKAKIEFFTHVAHEIKTPVTLIKAPLEAILNNEDEEKNRHHLEIIAKNTDRLLNLVKQLLDFKKINSEGYNINMTAAAPEELVHNVTNRFDGTSLGNINISVIIPQTLPLCLLDPEAYTKIVSNLMTNAVKHAREKICLLLERRTTENEDVLHLEISDDGCGIPETEQKRIFESFYQINTEDNPRMSGVGLGLSLVKLLVQKHSGKVYVNSGYVDGCSISVDIPFIKPTESSDGYNHADVYENDQEELAAKADSLNILVVEDTSDMLDFITGIFKDRHTIYKASNGKIALDILYKNYVDIIISDISMPVMNGFELLQEIRRADMLCHIPVIMLTVESSLETRIKGLEYGADAYIEKPFSTVHLLATVNNLINRREVIRNRFMANPLKKDNELTISSRDKEMFSHLTKLIQENIQEPDISIEGLASELNLSRSSFQRKIKGLTGLSPVEFIRLIRLKKAAELLSTGNYRINEVSYMVGFNKPSYFSALFKKQFGVLPKDFKG